MRESGRTDRIRAVYGEELRLQPASPHYLSERRGISRDPRPIVRNMWQRQRRQELLDHCPLVLLAPAACGHCGGIRLRGELDDRRGQQDEGDGASPHDRLRAILTGGWPDCKSGLKMFNPAVAVRAA